MEHLVKPYGQSDMRGGICFLKPHFGFVCEKLPAHMFSATSATCVPAVAHAKSDALHKVVFKWQISQINKWIVFPCEMME